MAQTLSRIAVGLLLFIHGFAHYQITTSWGAKTTIESWLVPTVSQSSLESAGTFLWVTTLVVFVAASFALFFGMQWWRPLAIAGSLLSLLVMAIFWQPNIIVGATVDAAIVVALLWVHWPTPQILGT